MKLILLIVVIAGAAAAFGFRSNSKYTKPKDSTKIITGTYKPVAVLELFTSEGCSSCPSADRLLPQLAKSDADVIPLSFHVDYWNRLGWTDAFSSSEFTQRQAEYVDQLKLESAYTPQLVINGEYELVGSDHNRADNYIKKALAEKSGVDIDQIIVKRNGSTLMVSCQAAGEIKNTELLAALVQKTATTKVRAGENGGSTLTHTNVVRSLVKHDAASNVNFDLTVPGNVADGNWAVVIYAQQKNTGHITGGTVYDPK